MSKRYGPTEEAVEEACQKLVAQVPTLTYPSSPRRPWAEVPERQKESMRLTMREILRDTDEKEELAAIKKSKQRVT